MRTHRTLVVGLVALTLAVLAGGTALQGCGDDDHRHASCCPVCGDGICSGDENGCNCSVDCSPQVCTEILSMCGNGFCETGASPAESHERCPADCALECRVCAVVNVP